MLSHLQRQKIVEKNEKEIGVGNTRQSFKRYAIFNMTMKVDGVQETKKRQETESESCLVLSVRIE